MTDPAITILYHNLPANNAGLLVNLKSIPSWAAKDPTADGSMSWAPQIYRGSSSVPADMKEWENYLTRLVTRYKGRIKYYETPNEANHEMKLTPQQILENNRVMYRSIKRIDPQALVVGPATAGTPTMAEWTGEYMAIGGKDITDIVSCHFYGQPEAHSLHVRPGQSGTVPRRGRRQAHLELRERLSGRLERGRRAG